MSVVDELNDIFNPKPPEPPKEQAPDDLDPKKICPRCGKPYANRYADNCKCSIWDRGKAPEALEL